ncbi:hypothetical protein RD792_017700 [Penstemon davidsonii]|uniref:UBL3-like ubiquitin domain-containing protein n=1 Tax=Penstemon davidsonii TaxID=160366 RepID=A0ABR0DW84_9LAMI|nr:hypothetical protein RD792_003385 [Penstemon davidsonii]KAK4493402.1 hypothetical protein RD792_017700 [Penstemon davidsonii]
MAEGDERLELKFRIYDGTDIGHGTYSSSVTVASIKQRLLSEWPQGCDSAYLCVYVNYNLCRNSSSECFFCANCSQLSGKSFMPKSVNDMKLIHAGKFLENGKTLAECRVHVDDLPGGVITMHVVVQPSVAKQKTDKNQAKKQKQSSCSCTIL